MTVKVGDRLPEATFRTMPPDGPKPMTTDEVFKGRRVALFAVPGAFTPTCSVKHLPGYRDQAGALKAKGVDAVACVSVNDAFVLQAWAASAGAEGKVTMLADGNGDFAEALGLAADFSKFGMGKRGQRWSAIVDDGVVDRDAGDLVDALRLELTGLLDEAGQMARRAGRRERAGHREERDLAAGKIAVRIDRLRPFGARLGQVGVGQAVADLDRHVSISSGLRAISSWMESSNDSEIASDQ
jgi:peroxiredoxin